MSFRPRRSGSLPFAVPRIATYPIGVRHGRQVSRRTRLICSQSGCLCDIFPHSHQNVAAYDQAPASPVRSRRTGLKRWGVSPERLDIEHRGYDHRAQANLESIRNRRCSAAIAMAILWCYCVLPYPQIIEDILPQVVSISTRGRLDLSFGNGEHHSFCDFFCLWVHVATTTFIKRSNIRPLAV
jgi:hypothetical protein